MLISEKGFVALFIFVGDVVRIPAEAITAEVVTTAPTQPKRRN